MADENQLWILIRERQQGVLATIKADGRPQLTNVLYVPDDRDRLVRISTTADRVKARNLARDARAALHVLGDDFWQYAVADGDVSLSEIAGAPNDPAVEELYAVHSAFYGGLERESFDSEMIQQKRLVVRLRVKHLYGIIATGGRRPVSENTP
jgi:PPOX class probable F420-dependent enzyme